MIGSAGEGSRHRGLKVFVLLCAVMTIALPAMAAKGGNNSTRGSGGTCAVSPNTVASGGALTVSGNAGKSGDWVNAYLYYSDGTWVMLGGSIGGGGSFSLSGTAVATHTSLWGPFYPAASGPGTVQISAGSANRYEGIVATCSFSVS
jgi:hypothetical protein